MKNGIVKIGIMWILFMMASIVDDKKMISIIVAPAILIGFSGLIDIIYSNLPVLIENFLCSIRMREWEIICLSAAFSLGMVDDVVTAKTGEMISWFGIAGFIIITPAITSILFDRRKVPIKIQ